MSQQSHHLAPGSLVPAKRPCPESVTTTAQFQWLEPQTTATAPPEPKRSIGRQGPLDLENMANYKKVKTIGACWPCQIKKKQVL